MDKEKLSFLAVLIAALAIVLSLVAVYLFPDQPLIWQISAGIGALGIVSYIYLQRTELKTSLKRKTTQYTLNSFFLTLIVFAVVVVINMIAANYDTKLDVSKNKLHTLSEQSMKVIAGLKSPVVLRVFVGANETADWAKVLEKYKYGSKLVSYEFPDLERDPTIVHKYAIKLNRTVIVEVGERTARIEDISSVDDPKIEEKITNAIISAAKGQKRKIYFVGGHGEHMPSDTGREGYSQMKESLENSRYSVGELVLMQQGKIPEDAEVLVIAGPKSEIQDSELKALEKFVEDGGRLLFLTEPLAGNSSKTFLAKFGIEWKAKQAVFEPNPRVQQMLGNPLSPLVRNFSKTHEITRDFRENSNASIFIVASPLKKMETVPQGYSVEVIASTTDASLAVEFTGTTIKADPKTAAKGPHGVAIAVSGPAKKAEEAKKEEKESADKSEKKDKHFRLVAVGDSDFGSNFGKTLGTNLDLFQNMLSWLVEEEDLISIRPRPTDESRLQVSEMQFKVLNLASAVILPLLMLISGLGMWLYRRRQ